MADLTEMLEILGRRQEVDKNLAIILNPQAPRSLLYVHPKMVVNAYVVLHKNKVVSVSECA